MKVQDVIELITRDRQIIPGVTSSSASWRCIRREEMLWQYRYSESVDLFGKETGLITIVGGLDDEIIAGSLASIFWCSGSLEYDWNNLQLAVLVKEEENTYLASPLYWDLPNCAKAGTSLREVKGLIRNSIEARFKSISIKFPPHTLRLIYLLKKNTKKNCSKTNLRSDRDNLVRHTVIIEKGEVGPGAYIPGLPGCIAVGHTFQQVKDRIHKAAEAHYSEMLKCGSPFPGSWVTVYDEIDISEITNILKLLELCLVDIRAKCHIRLIEQDTKI